MLYAFELVVVVVVTGKSGLLDISDLRGVGSVHLTLHQGYIPPLGICAGAHSWFHDARLQSVIIVLESPGMWGQPLLLIYADMRFPRIACITWKLSSGSASVDPAGGRWQPLPGILCLMCIMHWAAKQALPLLDTICSTASIQLLKRLAFISRGVATCILREMSRLVCKYMAAPFIITAWNFYKLTSCIEIWPWFELISPSMNNFAVRRQTSTATPAGLAFEIMPGISV